MCLSEELVASEFDHGRQAEDEQEDDEYKCYYSPDHIKLRDEVFPDRWLWLIQLCFNQTPSEGVEHGLEEDDAASPAMEKVERLVWNSSEHGQNRFS